MNKSTIREIAIASGFNLKRQPDGELDLNPYVYKFAESLIGDRKAVEQDRDQLKAHIKHLERGYDLVAAADTKAESWAIACLFKERIPEVSLHEHDAEVIREVFKHAYKSGFDHGLKCDKSEIESINRTATSIRLFDYQLECHIRAAAERYVHQKAQEPES